MTLFKKSLSLLLAIIVVFSSVSVMAFAADGDDWYLTDGKDNVAFEIKFFRNAGTATNPNWIETEKAKPGEAVKARLYVNTDFPTAASNISFAYNAKFFSVDEAQYPSGASLKFALTGNTDFEYSKGTLTTMSEEQAVRVTDLKDLTYNANGELVTNGYLTSSFADNFDLINSPLKYRNNDYAWILEYDPKYTTNWVFEYDLTVNKDDYVKTPGRFGEGFVPAGEVETKEAGTINGGLLTTPASYAKFAQTLPVNLFKYKAENTYYWSGYKSMELWKSNVSSTVGEISVFSDVLLDPNGGAFKNDQNKFDSDPQPITGVIGENYEPSDDDAYKPVKSGKKFVGWNTDPNATVALYDSELSQIIYDYEDITLYAVYEDADQYYYIYKEYLMDVDGNYPDASNPTFVSDPIYGEENAAVDYKVPNLPGYELDKSKPNVLEGVIDNASSTVLVVYFKRVGYDVIYNVDANTKWSPDEKVLFGADIPDYAGDEFEAPEGKKLIGWSVNENDTKVNVPTKMPAEDVNLYPVYADADTYTYLFNADGGVFDNGTADDTSDDTALKSLVFEKGEDPTSEVEALEDPVRDGYSFEGWTPDVPDEVTGDVTFTANWEPKEYKITFVVTDGGKFDDSTATKEVTFNFGEEVTGSTKLPADPERTDGWNFLMWNPTLPETMPAKDITVESVWTKEPVYTVIFGDSLNSSIVYGKTNGVEGTDVAVPDVADKNFGYDFAGWVVEGTDEVVTPDAKIGTSDKTYLATWEEAEYSITFDTNGGTPETIPEIIADYKEDISDDLPANPTLKGHDFKCWVDENGNEYTNKEALPETMPAGGLELKALWTPKNYNAIFITDAINNDKVGGGDVAGKFSDGKTEFVASTEYNKAIEAPSNPSADGYTFSHWETRTGEKLSDFATMPDKTLIFYAQYDYIQTNTSYYDIIIKTENLDGTYTTRTVEDQAIETGKSVKVSVTGTSTADYTIDYSSLLTSDEKKSQEPDETNVNNVLEIASASETTENVLVVYFQRKTVKATFNPNGGEFEDANEDGIVEGAYGSELTAPELKDREGYSGYVWEPEVPDTLEKDGVTYVANWTKKGANAIFYVNGEVYKTVPYEYGDKITAPEYTETPGKTFSGWVIDPSTMGETDLKFYATETDNEYSVTYIVSAPAELADKAPTDSNTYKYNNEVTVLAAPEVEGYEFKGWYLDNNKTKAYSANDKITVTSDIKLYGEYVKNEGHSVQFDLNGGTYNGSDFIPSQNYNYNDKLVNLPDEVEKFAKPDNEFIGWKDKDGNVYTVDSTMPDGDLILIAQWQESAPDEYTITVDPNGGTFPDGSTDPYKDTVAEGSEITDLPDNPTKENHEFKGWLNSATGEVVDKLPETMPSGDVTFTAQWEEIGKHTVTYYLAEGGAVHAQDTYYEGETIVLPEAPEIEGFDFGGWVTDLENGTKLPEKMGTEDIAAYAILTPHVHSVTYYLDDEKTEVYKEYDEVMFGSEVPVPADPISSDPTLIFAGWEPTPVSVMPDEDLEYVATWAKKPALGEQFVAKFTVDGKTHALFVLGEGEEIPEVSEPTKFGFVFVGWEPEVPETMPGEDVEFVAQWEIDKDIVYVVIGGTVISGVVVGGIIAGTNAAIITGAAIIGGVLVLWGVSELVKDTYTVTYMVDGEVYKTYKVLAGMEIPVPADPSKEGATFKGWNPDIPEKMPAEDLVFEAEWSSDTNVEIPDTGSVTGAAAFAVIAAAGAGAYLIARKKKEEDED